MTHLVQLFHIPGARVRGVEIYPLFPGRAQAQQYLRALEYRGCAVAVVGEDILSIQLPSGIGLLALGAASLQDKAWRIICDAAEEVGLAISGPYGLVDGEADLLEALEPRPGPSSDT